MLAFQQLGNLTSLQSIRETFVCWKEENITNYTIMKSYETNQKKTVNNSKNHLKLWTDINPTDSNFIASELTCVSVYRWRATGTDEATSTQVMLAQCIVGWTNIFISLFLYFSHSHLSHSHNSTFCLATAIPQMWSGLQRTITAQHQVAMTTTLYLICILCLHYLLMPNMVALLFSPPLSASPFNNFLFPSIFTTVSARFVSNVYVRTQTWTHACSLWVCEKRKFLWH